ncbi:MAG: domain S-box protein [Flavisolibacter sp.]|jgi:signal transduction histidine kinase|nr:domain S-box protein [Flavisolibacter sp.]
MKTDSVTRLNEDLQAEIEELKLQLQEAHETIEAIRTGQVDALVVEGTNGHQLYTLRSADQAFRVFIEKMTEGAVTLNSKGSILYCNSQFASLVKMPLSNVISLPFHQFIAPENVDDYQALFERCWTQDCKGEVLLTAGDHFTPVQLSLTKLALEEGVSLSIILTDLTAQKKVQQQLSSNNKQLAEINHALELSNHDLQQFASVASHDLQEPLRKIQLFSNLLNDRGGAQLTPESKKYLEKIIYSAGRMKALIIDVLNYSKLSANDNPFECIDLNVLIKELLDDFDLFIAEKKAVINVGELPCLYVNRGQIRQMFQNLLSNSLKFAGKEKTSIIDITAKLVRDKSFDSEEDPEGAFCLLTISDNGIGFDEKYAAKIFSLFERLHSKETYEGTGIGLAITKKIVEKHNGLIAAHSKEGEGARFLILLPAHSNHPGGPAVA